jgi:hypothetical protein
MKVSFVSVATVLGSFCFVTVSLSGALTPLQTAPFAFAEDGTFTDLDGSPLPLNASQPLSGFTKFDSNLGTLTEILLTAEVRATINVSIEASDIADPESFFKVYFEDNSFFQTSIIYSPTGESFGLSVTFDLDGFGSVGEDALLDPADWNGPDDFFFFDSTSNEYGGFANGDTTPTSGSLLASSLVLSDFVDDGGIGSVSGLQIAHIADIDTTPMLENINSAFVDVSIALDAGNATLQYVYTPVPEPKTFALILGLIILVFLRFRRYQG